jgi:hypothetical protein
MQTKKNGDNSWVSKEILRRRNEDNTNKKTKEEKAGRKQNHITKRPGRHDPLGSGQDERKDLW